MRRQPDAGAAGCKPPVWRERNEPVAVRTGDGPRPQITDDLNAIGFRRKHTLVLRLRPADELTAQRLERVKRGGPVSERPIDGGHENQRGDGVEVVRQGGSPQPLRFHGNAAAAGGRVEYRNGGQRPPRCARQPVLVFITWRICEGTSVAIRVRPQILPRALRRIDPASGRHRIAVNAEHVQKPAPVRVRRQEGGQHGGPRRHQRAPRPPDVQVVNRWQRGHRPPLADTLLTKCRNRKPPLDQPDIGHRLKSSRGGLPPEQARRGDRNSFWSS